MQSQPIVQLSTRVTFHGIDHSDALEAWIHEWAGKLARFGHRVARCEVTVEAPHRHQRHGRQWHVAIRLTLPGGDVVVSRDPGAAAGHEDPYVAVRDSFRAARRQLDARLAQRHHA